MPPTGRPATPVDPTDPRLRELLDALTLAEKVDLLTGRDLWSTRPLERIGLRAMVLSDGPSGVRGPVWDERFPSLSLPSASALAASWDTELARRYGACAAVEARSKGVDVVLGPTINLHRSPLGGRHFEAFSEDPVLTGELGAAVVAGLQENGVGATPKHYVANDSETERFTVDVVVGERALRELYLLAFEPAVTGAGAWCVMSAYNSVNGARATEHDLLETPLNSEWGFTGVVVSDWTAVRSLDSARFSQDLVMPGPAGPWGDALVAAVEAGEIPGATVDRKVLRILTLAARVGALDGFEAPAPPTPVDGRGFARAAAAEGMVLAANGAGILPLDPATVTSLAVIGHNALHPRIQGGGSATVVPDQVVAPVDGLAAAFPDALVSSALGAVVQEGVAELDPASMTNPVSGGPGCRVRFLDAAGSEIFAEDRLAASLVYLGGDAPVGGAAVIEVATRWTPTETATVRIGAAAAGTVRIHLDGELRAELSRPAGGEDPGAALLAPPSQTVPVGVTAGRAVEVVVELIRGDAHPLGPVAAVTVGTEPPDTDPDELIAEAAAVAAEAQVAVVVVGTNSRVESEGYDRSSLALPGRQDDLVRAVVAANPATVVVVNSGAPVLLPWRDEVAAVLLSWFPGQEFGHALADVVSGDREPGGRLPTTWPAAIDDVPVLDVSPGAGTLRYDEGIHIGYRAWLRGDATPAYPFGHGLGYTTWTLGPPTIRPGEGDDGDGYGVAVSVPVTNTGDRAGKAVIQVYAERPGSEVERPVRWLVGFGPVRLPAGGRAVARIDVPRRRFAHWDRGWVVEPGTFTLRVGTAVDRLGHAVHVDLD